MLESSAQRSLPVIKSYRVAPSTTSFFCCLRKVSVRCQLAKSVLSILTCGRTPPVRAKPSSMLLFSDGCPSLATVSKAIKSQSALPGQYFEERPSLAQSSDQSAPEDHGGHRECSKLWSGKVTAVGYLSCSRRLGHG